MKFRILTGAVLCVALATPVVASADWFPDVPDTHPRIDAIRYAREEGLMVGFPDGNLRPDVELTEGQFVKVAERLYDRYDVWTRADWSQVLYGGLPSLSVADGGPATTAVEGAPATADPAFCGWPLGEAEPVGDTGGQGYRVSGVRWPITPCSPPVTYRIEFHDQTVNLPFTAEGRTLSPVFHWSHIPPVDALPVKVTEFRPGGPVEGRVLGEVRVSRQAVAERRSTSAGTIPPLTTTTTAPPVTTTTAAPTTTTTTLPELDPWGLRVSVVGDQVATVWDLPGYDYYDYTFGNNVRICGLEEPGRTEERVHTATIGNDNCTAFGFYVEGRLSGQERGTPAPLQIYELEDDYGRVRHYWYTLDVWCQLNKKADWGFPPESRRGTGDVKEWQTFDGGKWWCTNYRYITADPATAAGG